MEYSLDFLEKVALKVVPLSSAYFPTQYCHLNVVHVLLFWVYLLLALPAHKARQVSQEECRL